MKVVLRILLDIVLSLLLLLPAASIGAMAKMSNPACVTCGANIATTVWIAAILALQPALWTDRLRKRTRFRIWSLAVLAGSAAYVALEFVSIALVAAGIGSGVVLGFASNFVFYGASFALALVLAKKEKIAPTLASMLS